MSPVLTRRSFLRKSATSGSAMILGFYLPRSSRLAAIVSAAQAPFAPNAWLEISSGGAINIWCGHSEMGQGVQTSLPMLVAEELSCDWLRVKVIQADLDSKYGNQITGGSGSVRSSFDTLRQAGAAAREMLVIAAASAWAVLSTECRAENGFVLHVPTGRKILFEKLVDAASRLPAPTNPPLKNPSTFALLGKPTRRTDAPAKVTGSAKFGIDIHVPGMLIASMERCRVYGGSPRSFNAAELK